jgi:DNA polymerase III subunit epsilon
MTVSFNYSKKEISEFARKKLAERPVYLDTETTGLDRSDEIVEIAIVDDTGDCLYQSLVRPSKKIPAESIRIHGISNEMVQTARPWPILWPVIRTHLIGRLIVIYNADFDLRMMQQSHSAYKLPWRENLNALCVMNLYAQYHGEWDQARRGYRNVKLDVARQQCGLELPNSHRALADAQLARALFHYIAEHQ